MRDELLSIWPKDGTIKSILDLGCRDCWHTAALPGVTRHVGVEVWLDALERGIRKSAAGGIPNFEPVMAEALSYLQGCADDAFDAVLAIDLLEHFGLKDARLALTEMTRVAGKLAVIWTTLGYIDQPPYDVDGNFNPYEYHRWGPTPDIFTNAGWQVRLHPTWHEARGGAILTWKTQISR